MDLSIIIPIYNGETFVKGRLLALSSYLESLNTSYELIAVDDGSTDHTAEVLRSLSLPHFRPVFQQPNQGKFAAIVCGMRQAQGRCRIFTDADVPYDLEAFQYMAQLVNQRQIHLVIGDRTLTESYYSAGLPKLRQLATRSFTWFVRLFVTSGLADTQCGLKAVRGDVAEALFPLLQERGFAGDVELLYIALVYNLEIKRIPARLQFHGASTVSLFRHGLSMLRSLFRIRSRRRRGEYKSAQLENLSRQDYWQPPKLNH